MPLLTKESPISKDQMQGDSFVRFGDQVALGDSYSESHRGIALENQLFYPESRNKSKIQIDDAGLITDCGDILAISKYVSTTTQLALLVEKYGEDYEDALREIRLETGKIVASITNKPVEVEFKGRKIIQISPNQ
jgi:hypothetical protein